MVNLVFLPATAPDDGTYGAPPERVESRVPVSVRCVRFSTMVWYNEPVRREAISQVSKTACGTIPGNSGTSSMENTYQYILPGRTR